ncbi:hypothetical protein Pden_5123 (plasmid) [Paracoccus denitrificans PD1222]|uniref:Uncharacterized protein n=1 Tax=Paracoccus denitrificans (strain Pd 1222) TaxID=318586 RepID=A1BCD9_PARDP|nr:hypothetical protein Pden_5123 [Paracoccus denitrificans PD1222]
MKTAGSSRRSVFSHLLRSSAEGVVALFPCRLWCRKALQMPRIDRIAVVQDIRSRLERLTLLENGLLHFAFARFVGHFKSSKRAAQGCATWSA